MVIHFPQASIYINFVVPLLLTMVLKKRSQKSWN